MTNYEAENFNVRSSDNVSKGGHALESIHQHLTNKEFKKHLQNRIEPDVCIRDQDGFITCGPIVGYERPEESLQGKILKPMEPIGKTPIWQEKLDVLQPHKSN